jgi:hypothetical protein
MAKPFTKIKDPKLGLKDIIPIGKFKGCRVCDIIKDDWEYLKWMHTNTSVKFQTDVLEEITAAWDTWSADTHYQEEIAPYMYDANQWGLTDEDVPF